MQSRTVHRKICRLVVHVKCLIYELRLLQRKLHLIENKRLLHIFFQQFNLHGHQVADTEMTYLTCLFKHIESLCDLLRIKQQIRSVQQQRIQIFYIQTAQAVIDTGQNIFFCPVKFISVKAQSALALDINILAPDTGQRKSLCKTHLCLTVSIAGSVVKKVDVTVVGCADDLRCIFF